MAHRFFATKLHFAFGWMNVHVHFRGIKFEEQTADRIASLHQRSVVAFQQRKVERAVFDGPAVDEQVLVLPRRPRNARRAEEAPNANRRRTSVGRRGPRDIARLIWLANVREIIDRQQLRFGPEQSAQTLLKRGLFGRERAVASERRQLPDGALVLQKSESDLGKSQRRQRQVMLDVGALGFLAAKKFSARRQVVKQLTHFDVRARRVTG